MNFDYEYKVNGIEDLFKVIRNISIIFADYDKKVYTDKVHGLWYRGHQSTKYKLLPSAMRRLEEVTDDSKNLRNYQRASYEQFKFRLCDASETINTSSYTDCDYLALMQHYGVATIYLDWSENAIAALYFALEAYIDPKKFKEQNQEDAVLFVLHPNLYNKARDELIRTVTKKSGLLIEDDIRNTIQEKTETLPNLSVEYNKNKYYMFLLGETDEKNIPDYSKVEPCLKKGSDSLLYLPLAIYSSRANTRIRSQYGMLMAFNIFTPLHKEENFKYMALEKVQTSYLKIFENKEPFMYKIIIKNESKQQIADWLKAIGITKDMIYPELSNISERI